MIRAIKLVLKEKAIIDVYYFDRTVKRFDVLSLVDKYPQFKELTDRNLFLKGRLMGWSAIVWNDELDVDTEYIYEDGIDVSKEIGFIFFNDAECIAEIQIDCTNVSIHLGLPIKSRFFLIN